MLSKLILILLLILTIYTLYYTWTNDYGMFLSIVLFMLLILFIYQSFIEKISYYENIANKMISEQLDNLSNIKEDVFNKFID